MAYTTNEIKIAAYNQTEPPGMDANERAFWIGMSYCYEWFRQHPKEQMQECKALARQYAEIFESGIFREKGKQT